MEDQAGILQQRVEIAPFCSGRQQAVEGVGGNQNEGQQADADQSQHRQHPRHHDFGQLARSQRYGGGPTGQHQHPQQQGTLVAAPYGGEAIEGRQLRVGMLGDIVHRKIVDEKALRQADEGDGDQQELRLRRRPRQGDPLRLSALGADQRQHALDDGNDKGEDEGKVSEFWGHGFFGACSVAGLTSGAFWLCCACFSAAAASGGM